ncbi:MAG: hypothetical protein KC457_33855, partial [Myxococcales bacterium]|nr:hypothetical protein [Myxococcales bacterium]
PLLGDVVDEARVLDDVARALGVDRPAEGAEGQAGVVALEAAVADGDRQGVAGAGQTRGEGGDVVGDRHVLEDHARGHAVVAVDGDGAGVAAGDRHAVEAHGPEAAGVGVVDVDHPALPAVGAQAHGVGGDVTLLELILVTGEAAVDRHAVADGEGGRGVARRRVLALGDPDRRRFTADDGVDGKSYLDHVNPNSLEVVDGVMLEPALAGHEVGVGFQLERLGYFCVDPDSKDGAMVLNRTIGLRDSWAKLEKQLG